MNGGTPELVKQDPWLEPFAPVIRYRQARYRHVIASIEKEAGSLKEWASHHRDRGLLYDHKKKEWQMAEWLPEALEVSLVGDFNNWSTPGYALTRGEGGVWRCRVPQAQCEPGQRYKLRITAWDGQQRDRIPATAQRVVQDAHTLDFAAVVPPLSSSYPWQVTLPPVLNGAPLIYEAHVGIAGEEKTIHTYRHFADHIIPRIKELGYNAIQLMALAEHPYYGSFGYHVSSYFAPSSRFGPPEDLKYLIDTAHLNGLVVLMDVVHSHAVKNTAEGLNELDGSKGQYFHLGERGEHPDWDSKCFEYGRPEVQQFLLSNLRYWMEEYRIDGFRFDGVTSMLYWHRGKKPFTEYQHYFNQDVDNDAILYLQLATTLIRQLSAFAPIIAEDMSGLPGLCRPIHEGGVGFTHRLAMGLPDYWIELLKERRDEDWDLGEIWHRLQDRRAGEKHIAYTESHDQALVGDQTMAFRLMGEDMYWHMQKGNSSPVIERGMALHKMIRLLTFSAGGEGYLTFMGNEFGHPEWIDFPREGNDWSHQYARRQWSLRDNEMLQYGSLDRFEKAMLRLAREYDLLEKGAAECLRLDSEAKVLAYRRGPLLFVFNFSVGSSYEGSEVYLPKAARYCYVLSSDQREYGGLGRIDPSVQYHGEGQPARLKLYLPSRSALVLAEEVL